MDFGFDLIKTCVRHTLMFFKPHCIGGRWDNWVIERLSMGWIPGIQFLARAGISLCSVGLHGQSNHVSCVYQFTSCRWKYSSLLFRALISVRCLRQRVIAICLSKCTTGRNHEVLWAIMWDIVGIRSSLMGGNAFRLYSWGREIRNPVLISNGPDWGFSAFLQH